MSTNNGAIAGISTRRRSPPRESDSGFEVNGAPTPGLGTRVIPPVSTGQKCLNANLRSRRKRNLAAVVAGHIAPEDSELPRLMPRYLHMGREKKRG